LPEKFTTSRKRRSSSAIASWRTRRSVRNSESPRCSPCRRRPTPLWRPGWVTVPTSNTAREAVAGYKASVKFRRHRPRVL